MRRTVLGVSFRLAVATALGFAFLPSWAGWFGPNSEAECLEKFAAKGATQLAVRALAQDCRAEFAQGGPRSDELDRIRCRRDAIVEAKTDLGVRAASEGCEKRYPVPAYVRAAEETLRQEQEAKQGAARYAEYVKHQEASWATDAARFMQENCEFLDDVNRQLLDAGIKAYAEHRPTQNNAELLRGGASVARKLTGFRHAAGCYAQQPVVQPSGPVISLDLSNQPPPAAEKPPACEYSGVMSDEDIRRCQNQ
jgi:hypothetical protein